MTALAEPASEASTNPSDSPSQNLRYKELLAQAQELQAQAEALRQQEVINVISQIRSLATQYGLGAEDIFGGRKVRTPGKPMGAANCGYRCPSSGAMWSGRGRRPQWIKDAMTAGQDIAAFKVA